MRGAERTGGDRGNREAATRLAPIVTEIKLTLADLNRTESLPAICVRCGRKATGFRGMRLTSSESKQSSSFAWIMWELGLWTLHDKEWYENVMHELKITKGRLKLPVCWWHRWIVPPFIGVQWLNDRTVALSHGSDGFVAEMKKRGWVR